MAYQRAGWHSGLTYSQVCAQCKTKVTYMDDKLDFRPWYADGFIYCPTCRTPLRHREEYAINRPDAVDMTMETAAEEETQSADAAVFCSGCGRAFQEGENFCPTCGKKRA